MKINYLFSGLDKVNGFTSKQKELLKKDIKEKSNITFIASSFNNPKRNDIKHKELVKMFNDINIKFNNIYLIDERVNSNKVKELINNSDIIFLMGGDPKSEMDSLIEYDLINVIKNMEGIIIGVSAGTMNQTTNVIYKDEIDNSILVKYKGLGFFDTNIYPHVDINNKDYLQEIFEVSKYEKILCLPENSFIRIENDNINIYGDYYYIEYNSNNL